MWCFEMSFMPGFTNPSVRLQNSPFTSLGMCLFIGELKNLALNVIWFHKYIFCPGPESLFSELTGAGNNWGEWSVDRCVNGPHTLCLRHHRVSVLSLDYSSAVTAQGEGEEVNVGTRETPVLPPLLACPSFTLSLVGTISFSFSFRLFLWALGCSCPCLFPPPSQSGPCPLAPFWIWEGTSFCAWELRVHLFDPWWRVLSAQPHLGRWPLTLSIEILFSLSLLASALGHVS